MSARHFLMVITSSECELISLVERSIHSQDGADDVSTGPFRPKFRLKNFQNPPSSSELWKESFLFTLPADYKFIMAENSPSLVESKYHRLQAVSPAPTIACFFCPKPRKHTLLAQPALPASRVRIWIESCLV